MMKQAKRTKALVSALGVAVAGISVGGEPERATLERVLMTKKCLFFLALIEAFALLSTATAAEYFVSEKRGSDDNNGLSWESPLKTLDKFTGDSPEISPSGTPMTITLDNGTYRIDKTLSLRNVAVVSLSGDPETTVIDAQGKCQAIWMQYPFGSIQGVTVRNGYATETSKGSFGGAGICIDYGSGNMVSNCIVSDCHVVYRGTSVNVGGGGIYANQGKLIDSVVTNCSFTVDCGTTGAVFAGGGGVFGKDNFTMRRTRIDACRLVFSSSAKSCGGGGICLNGKISAGNFSANVVNGCTVVDSAGNVAMQGGGVWLFQTDGDGLHDTLVRGCSANLGGGVAMFATRCTVSSCTITNNVAVNGGGVYVGLHPNGRWTILTNCLVAANVATEKGLGDVSGESGNGGGIEVSPPVPNAPDTTGSEGIEIVDCAIMGNRAVGVSSGAFGRGGGVHFRWYRAYNANIRGCVIEGNSASSCGGGIYSYDMHDGIIRNTMFLGNRAQDGAAIYHQCGRNTSSFSHWSIWNCLVKDNEATRFGVLSLFGTVSCTSNTVEHCTIADNNAENRNCYAFDYRNFENGATSVSNLHVNACVVYGNGDGYKRNFGLAQDAVPVNVTRTYSNGIPFDDSHSNVNPDEVAPDLAFASYAEGDWRLVRRSPLVDAAAIGGEGFGWMKGRQVFDMGDGTYSLKPVDAYGIAVVRNNVNRRWMGASPDIGCFEFKQKSGFMVLVR